MPVFRPVDNDAEHHRILCELGLLDDMDNWPMYQAQEARFDLVDSTIGLELWRSHVNWPPGQPPRTQVATPLMQSLSAAEVAGWQHALDWLEPNREIPGLFIEAMALAERLGDPTPRA